MTSFVLRWYRAVAALLQAATLLGSATGHMEAAQKLFPHDPLVLFYAGAMQEALASTVFQNILHARPDVVVRGRPKFETPRSTYLRSAERFLRESVEQGGPVEARVRLGRVLGELGRHADAAATLRDVLPHVDDPVLRYFAELFLGSEEEALGRRDEARACFERAAALLRGAQSPLLALSALEWRAGRPAAALVALNRLQALHASVDRDDPWWSYFRSYAFDANQQLASVRASLQLKRVE